ncbi:MULTISPECIES: hypothetical protein [Flavobacterium]|jgi:hypothetical protein|uniref:Uncharacterized protein n=1 Tax=Flavobacterium piscisymbiosum TaxID=2893753 RepID=A0ABS8MGU2_9FLAO|nr:MULTISPECIES: hypothetical protein [unclassified Flavobacterium]MCC9064707.1 hypothetical protein [Flavobacterium sp. F-30]QGK74357.1 hypothetical protein GIY83_09905 [Flavobacterium sp. SLB02]
MTTFTSADILKQQKTLKILASIFLFLSYLIGLGALIGTLYLLFTPRGIGGWILPAFSFLTGLIVFLFLFSISKIITILIEISYK